MPSTNNSLHGVLVLVSSAFWAIPFAIGFFNSTGDWHVFWTLLLGMCAMAAAEASFLLVASWIRRKFRHAE